MGVLVVWFGWGWGGDVMGWCSLVGVWVGKSGRWWCLFKVVSCIE